jgi:hypothetical protein
LQGWTHILSPSPSRKNTQIDGIHAFVPGKPDIIDNPHHVSASDQVIGDILRFLAVGYISFDQYSGEICGQLLATPITDHPPSTRASAVARPMPFDAPVMTMDLTMAAAQLLP